MDKTILEGRWNDIRGRVKVWWSKLTENDLDRIAGKFDILVRELQEKYGYSRRQTVQEVSRRVIDYRIAVKNSRSRSPFR